MKTSESMSNIAGALLKAQQANPDSVRHLESVEVPRLARLVPRQKVTVLQRFMSYVAFGASDCWFWYGSTDNLGYGRMKALDETKAHRLSWVLHNGPVPDGMHVLHSCDVRNCVNPAHLSLGTHAENMRDMAVKGRVVNADVTGEKNPMAKLNRELVAVIRARFAAGDTQRLIAETFGFSPMCINRVVRGISWK